MFSAELVQIWVLALVVNWGSPPKVGPLGLRGPTLSTPFFQLGGRGHSIHIFWLGGTLYPHLGGPTLSTLSTFPTPNFRFPRFFSDFQKKSQNFKNCQKFSKISKIKSEIPKFFENIWKNFWNFKKKSTNFQKFPPKISKNLLDIQKILGNIWNFEDNFGKFWNFLEIFEILENCPKCG